MARKDERSGTDKNNTTNVSEERIGKAWLAKQADKSQLDKARAANDLGKQRRAGEEDRN